MTLAISVLSLCQRTYLEHTVNKKHILEMLHEMLETWRMTFRISSGLQIFKSIDRFWERAC